MKTCSKCCKVQIPEHYIWCNECENEYLRSKYIFNYPKVFILLRKNN